MPNRFRSYSCTQGVRKTMTGMQAVAFIHHNSDCDAPRFSVVIDILTRSRKPVVSCHTEPVEVLSNQKAMSRFAAESHEHPDSN